MGDRVEGIRSNVRPVVKRVFLYIADCQHRTYNIHLICPTDEPIANHPTGMTMENATIGNGDETSLFKERHIIQIERLIMNKADEGTQVISTRDHKRFL